MRRAVHRVLVTGASGFIGSHLLARLVKEGYSVRALDAAPLRLGKDLQSRVQFIRGDIRDQSIASGAAKGMDAIVHLAALIDVRESIKRPTLYHDVNATGTLRLLEAAHKAGVKRFIFASTCAVYGEAERVPIDETQPTRPLSPYAASKLAAEAYCHAYARAYGLNVIILRLFNIYGPGQRDAYAGVIQRFIDRVRRHKPPIIYGSGQQVRDFLHVQDATEAIARSVAYEGENPATFNIGSGKGTKIIELAKLICRLAGREELKPARARARKGEIHVSLANIEKATKELNYHPRVSLENGIKQLLTSQQPIKPIPPIGSWS